MSFRLTLKKWGNSNVFVIPKEIMENYEMNQGNLYDIEICDITHLKDESLKLDLEKSEEDFETTSNEQEEIIV